MDWTHAQLIAGTMSSLIFASSAVPMLVKVMKSHDLHSFSFSHIVLTNVGNTIHWCYILSLPLGPIWLLHAFFTVTSLLLLLFYLRYERRGHSGG